jgi:hypothetical protein
MVVIKQSSLIGKLTFWTTTLWTWAENQQIHFCFTSRGASGEGLAPSCLLPVPVGHPAWPWTLVLLSPCYNFPALTDPVSSCPPWTQHSSLTALPLRSWNQDTWFSSEAPVLAIEIPAQKPPAWAPPLSIYILILTASLLPQLLGWDILPEPSPSALCESKWGPGR